MLFTEVIKLLPGFRFRPTDEELVSYYLKRKVLGRLFPFEVIAAVDLYKYEPWDLPEKSALLTRDLEWYFFIPRDRKYPNGFRTNRATAKGYWKSTGKDRSVSSSSRVVGTKKTLVYYNGRAPKGERTNWVMHEYRLSDVECQKIRAVENGFVLCRVYQKSGVGPKNGEQYGAPVEDDDFEDSPTLEVDGCDSLKLELMERGPSGQNTLSTGSLTAQDDDDCVSFGIDVVGQQLSFSGFEPRNLNMDFQKLYGDLQQNGTQNFTCSASRDVLLAANREVIDRVVASPVTLEDEAEMLEQLLRDCTNHLNSTDGYHNNSIIVEEGCYQTGANVPSDGGFLELDDLLSVSDSEEDKTSANNNARNAIIGLKNYAEEAQGFVMQALPTFDACEAWENTFSGDAPCEGEQVMAEVIEMQSMVSYDFGQEPFRKNMLGRFPPPLADYNEDIGPAGPTQPIEPEDMNGMKMLNHLNAYVNEKDVFKELLDCEGSPELLVQDLGYFDAVPLFTDIDACEESTNTKLEGCNDHGSPQLTLTTSQWANKFNEVLDDRNLKAKDDSGSSQGQAVCLEPERRSPSSLSLFFRLMDSLPTLPASAAELSPKATSPGGSIHLTATGIAMGSVSVTCTCIGESVPSSCVNCSVTEAEKKGHFVRSMSFWGQRKKPLNRWDMDMLISAVFGALLAVFFGLLVAAGAWKGWGVVCKLISSSKT